ncbi:MAG: copper chaperone PCu(A)C [Aggregatilineales bacterium]
MKMRFLILSILIGLLLVPNLVFAHSGDDGIYIIGAWARSTAAADVERHAEGSRAEHGEVSAVYMQIENPGSHPIQLIDARTNVATVELHETTMDGDLMRMNRIEGITIGTGEMVALEPGGLHIMLLDLQRPLVEGEAIALTLIFEMLEDDGSPMGETVEVLVGVPILAELAEVTSDLVITSAWARPTASAAMEADEHEMHEHGHDHNHSHGSEMGGMVSAAYMNILNRGQDDDRLIAASTNVAVVEIHETTMDGDLMRMREIPGIDLAAGEIVRLQPGGLHLMLLDAEPLVEGEAVALTLEFESGRTLTIGVPVFDRMMGMDHDHDHGNHHHHH